VVKEVPRCGRLRHADRAGGQPRGDRRVPRPHRRPIPEQYIAQPTLALSTCPTFVERASRRATSTCGRFVLSGREVTIVPGGLTRVALREGSLVVNSSQGGGTKDTWVLEADMLSRTADHLYWMSRYTGARRESGAPARLVYRRRCAASRGRSQAWRWRPRWRHLGARRGLCARSAASSTRSARSAFLATDPRACRQHRLAAARGARELPRAVRGTITAEVWETLNTSYIDLRGAAERDRGEFLDWVKYRSHLSRGVTVGTMLRDEAFHFTRIGIYLERADFIPRLIVSHWRSEARGSDAASWSVLLRALSAFEVYRRVFRDSVTPRRVVELLLLQRDFPRSLRRCLSEVVTSLAAVRNEASAETERQAGALHADLQFGRMADHPDEAIPELLERIERRVRTVALGVTDNFLVPAG
jgi:uncharacterized alpha-E superfamily protein